MSGPSQRMPRHFLLNEALVFKRRTDAKEGLQCTYKILIVLCIVGFILKYRATTRPARRGHHFASKVTLKTPCGRIGI